MRSIRSVGIVMTSHNRRDLTVSTISAVLSQREGLAFDIDIVLVDAGSTDGTVEAIEEQFPSVRVDSKSRDVYWTQGTKIGFDAVVDIGFDAYIWLNDDVQLDTDALSRLVACYEQLSEEHGHLLIVIGSMSDSSRAVTTFGGMRRRKSLSRVSFEKIIASTEAQRADTMNGNLVLIPRSVAERVGSLEPRFRQNRGDVDYGLRAAKAGAEIWVAPGTFGVCEPNPPTGRWDMRSSSLIALWKTVLDTKEVPPGETYVYLRRHAGFLWPLIWLKPYLYGIPKTLAWYRRRLVR